MDVSAPPPESDRTILAPFGRRAAAPSSAAPTQEDDGNALHEGERVLEFEIVRVLGIGGFGIVYLAFDHSLQINIALKEYMPSSVAERASHSQVVVKSRRDAETFDAGLRSFINEARLLAQFDHPSLVKVYRFWEYNGTAYMVMPFYEGLTLKQTLKTRTAPPDEWWLKNLLAALLDALETLHHEQCYHRDIAPDNILMLEDGRPLLLDFGAARRAISGMDQAFTVILKPGYAPVEQYADVASMQQGPWTDIYALGSVIYFAITGQAPAPSVMRMISDTQAPLKQCGQGRYSPGFLAAIDRCMAVLPQDRPQSIAALRAALGLDTKPVTRPAPAPAPASNSPAQRASNKGRLSYIAAGMIVVAVLVVGTFWMTRPDGTMSTPNVAKLHTPDATAPSPTAAAPPPTAHSPPAPVEPTAQAPEPAVRPLDPIGILSQIMAARDKDHAVSVSLPRQQVRIGIDRLEMAVTSAKSGYVYLLMVGTDHSEFTLLFPNEVDKNNRITPGKPLDLPRKGWKLSAVGPPGTNHLVAIVSAFPRQFTDAGLVKAGLFGEFPASAIAKAQPVAEGAIPLFAGSGDCERKPQLWDCVKKYGAAQFSITEVAAR